MKNLILFISIIIISCGRDAKNDGQILKIFNSSNELILEDDNAQVNEKEMDFILIKLSEKNRSKLRAVSSARIGQDIFIEWNGKIIKKVRILNAIQNGVIRLDLTENAVPIFDTEAEAVEHLLPEK